ncbi:hypothetical protein GCM10011338_19870 [Alteromonas lipolytica]|nr:hypothetical protein GCM10011338_19870 [Alteromonas lipolytica]
MKLYKQTPTEKKGKCFIMSNLSTMLLGGKKSKTDKTEINKNKIKKYAIFFNWLKIKNTKTQK